MPLPWLLFALLPVPRTQHAMLRSWRQPFMASLPRIGVPSLRAKDTGAWLWVMPSYYHGTDLSAQEFRDALHLRYARTPPDLPSSCDGCGQSFTMDHALECQHGGLVIIRHNEVRDELVDLASRVFSPSAVRVEPLIYPGRSAVS